MNILETLLNHYNISLDEYKEITKPQSLNTFSLGHEFDNADKAKIIINDAINNKEKIIVYGDYDADGIMGTSILISLFKKINYPIDYYVPSRYIDGYGLNIDNAKKCIENGYKLVITVDNGITAFEAIEELKNNNIKVLVLDHHTFLDKLPNADVIMHPLLSHYGDIPTSGAFVALMLSKAILGYYDEYLSILAAISLITDMMPLKGYNRNLFKAVSDSYKFGIYKQIDLLLENKNFTSENIGLKLGPKINAIGRMVEDDSINDIVKYFTEDDEEFILNYFTYLNDVNIQRKNLFLDKANNIKIVDDDAAIVEVVNLKSGLIGLLANSLVNKYKKPTIIFTKEANGELKGSARCLPGFNITESFNKLQNYLICSGGHAYAGGCSLKEENFQKFKQEFINLVKNMNISPIIETSYPITINDLNLENLRIIESFAPFGEGWREPKFLLKHIPTKSLFYSKDQNHIITSISHNVRFIGFNFPRRQINQYNYVNLTGKIQSNIYNGYFNIVFSISSIEENIH